MTERPFEDGEKHYTAIYFDVKTGEYTRRDVSLDAWKQELGERTPFSFWKSIYEKQSPDGKAEITPREDAQSMLQRLIEEGQPHTENARYILAAMLERKRVLAPKDRKETEEGIMLVYENRKTGEIYVVRDPELRLDEVASVQEEVATLLGFGGPVVEAAKVAGVKLTKDGRVKKADEPKAAEPAAPASIPEEAAPTEAVADDASVAPADAPEASQDEAAGEDVEADEVADEEEEEEEEFDDEDDDFEDVTEDEDEDADEETDEAPEVEEESPTKEGSEDGEDDFDDEEDEEDEDENEDEEDDDEFEDVMEKEEDEEPKAE